MRAALAGVAICALLVAAAAPAIADDASPAPTTTLEPSPLPPTEPPAPEPSEPTPTPPIEVTPAPTPPAAPKPASTLPLRLGAHGWRVKILQDRLVWLGYEITATSRAAQKLGDSTVAAVKKAQAKFGYRPTGVVGPGTWELIGDMAGTVGKVPAACRKDLVVCVDKTTKLVRLVDDGTVRKTLDARFGFTGAETREGTFHVTRKSRDHVSSLYRTSMPFAMFFSGGQAVHYSPYFARDGYNGGSHGCVNLRDYDGARWLFDHVPLGTTVYVYRS
jgi:lipoprotein-anchoring transpeptidase ErfK/SrfK